MSQIKPFERPEFHGAQAILTPLETIDSKRPFTISKGNPTDEELGAVIAVLAAVTAEVPATENEDRHTVSGWKSYWRSIRQPLTPGREVWRGSLR